MALLNYNPKLLPRGIGGQELDGNFISLTVMKIWWFAKSKAKTTGYAVT